MSDWRIVTTDESSHDSRISSRFALRRSWLMWLGIIAAILAVAGLLALRQQRALRQQALRKDLKAHIFQEETERFLGPQAQIANLIVADAPPAWQQAYRHEFTSPADGSPPGLIEIDEVEFDGQCALVTVSLAGQTQIRYYCLSNLGWLRAPIPESAWGEPVTMHLANGVTLRFRSRDRAFAESLVPDLNHFSRTLVQHQLWPGQSANGETTTPLEIVIEPHEFQWLPLRTEEDRLSLISPWLFERKSQDLSVEGLLRWSLAVGLAQRIKLDTPAPLPGIARFQEALRLVLALQFLSSKDQAALLNEWRSDLGPEWASPFFADFMYPEHPDPGQQAQRTALLTAHYIYNQEGLPVLLEVMKKIPETTSWDHLFETTLGRSTMALEQEVRRYAYLQAGNTPLSEAGQQSDPLSQPLQGTLSELEVDSAGHQRAYLEISGQTWPLPVELPAALLVQTSGAEKLAPGCLVPGAQLEVQGNWLEAQRRLEASQIILQGEMTPLDLGPAPADTVAYLIQGEATTSEAAAGNQPYAKNYTALKPNYLSAYRTLLALQSNNTLHPITLLNPASQVFPLPLTAENQVQLLFILNLEGCDRAWFIHYRPDQGIIRQWLTPPEPMQWLWRADKQDLIFFDANSSSQVHEIYGSGPTFLPELLGTVDIPLGFIGWNTENSRVVSNMTRLQETYLGLFDLDTRNISFDTYPNPLRYYRLSPGGNWLAYLNQSQPDGPLQRLEVLNMSEARPKATLLVELTGDHAFWPPVWSMNLTEPRIAILGGPVIPDQRYPSAKWLILTDPNYPNGELPLLQALEGDSLAYPVFCGDGSLLYRLDRADQYRLLHYSFGSPPETLLTLNWPFQPLACP